jgi:hypothetical protein
MSVEPNGNGAGPTGVLEALPGMARVTATVWLHGAEWALENSIKAGWRVLDAAGSPRKTADLVRDARGTARGLLRNLLAVTKLEEQWSGVSTAADVARKVADAVPFAPEEDEPSENGSQHRENGVPRSLREQGELLLRRSSDVHYEIDAHPAYERILSELAPDEGRILRLLLVEGPQPSVDIRTGGPTGMIKSRLVAPGISMIGALAGCRYVDRVHSYLNNLFRLGLVWFSRETLADPMRYQVLEAQPDVLEAIHQAGHAKVVRRSIHLTPFGEDFCRVCFPPKSALVDQLPQHSPPPAARTSSKPPSPGET